MVKTYNIIVAAGSGSRFGGELPKQFCPLAGRPVVMHTVEALRRALPEGEVLLVLAKAHVALWRELCRRHGFCSPPTVVGGRSRWESVGNAVMSLAAPAAGEVITVHDGARPLVPEAVVREAVLAAAAGCCAGAVPAVPVTDSIRMLAPEGPGSTPLPRQRLRAVQTPQAFPARLLRDAYSLPFSPDFTDDASVVTAYLAAHPDAAPAGCADIALTAGSPDNIKITHHADLALAEAILAARHAGA